LRSLWIPTTRSSQAPGDMPARIIDLLQAHGPAVPRGRGEIVRCILESLALKHADVVETLVAVTGRRIETLCMVGGGATRPAVRMDGYGGRATALCRPTEATLIGNFLMQATALGELNSSPTR